MVKIASPIFQHKVSFNAPLYYNSNTCNIEGEKRQEILTRKNKKIFNCLKNILQIIFLTFMFSFFLKERAILLKLQRCLNPKVIKIRITDVF